VNDGPIYVYNPAEQYQTPLFIVYDLELVEPFAAVIGFTKDDLHLSRTRLHPYDRDRYKSMGSVGFGKKPQVSP
jgi:hypothetical protein